MSGLLSGVLPFIYSQSNKLKRNVNDWVSNPAAKAEQSAGILYDTLREQIRLQNQAFGDPKNPLKITDQRAFEAATNGILNGVMGFAPAGMIAYHGSRVPTIEAFDTAGHHAQKVAGAYFSKNPKEASRYAKGEGGTVYPVDINFKNPATRADLDALPTRVNGEFPDGILRRAMLQERGFDGLIDDFQDEVVVFDPKQIQFLLQQQKR